MNAKEKAEELILKYDRHCKHDGVSTKFVCLTTVYEILALNEFLPQEQVEFWQEVLKELKR